jgi:hypothetical protein
VSPATGTGLSRRLAGLFLLALAGVLVAGGVLAGELGGAAVLAGYVALAGLLVALGVARGRRMAAAASAPRAQRCACCDGDHTAPVRVL